MLYRLIALICLFAGPTFAKAEQQFPVEVQLRDGTKLQGFLTEPTIRFTFEGGTATLDTAKLDRLELGGNDKDEDTATVHGLHSPFRGRCGTDVLVIQVNGEKRTYPRGQIQSIRSQQPRATGFFGRIIVPLVTLTLMEIVLGIDNIIFLAIVASRLPEQQQPRARRLGLIAALGTRLGLLATLSFILSLTAPVWTLPDMPLFHELESRQISYRDIILLAGGLFLIWKSTFEIHKKMEGGEESHSTQSGTARFGMVLIQIAILDIIFSLDSVITAVGMVESLGVMITAMIIAVLVMMLFAEPVSRFVLRHPTVKVLALAFLILIGVLLVAEGCGQHIDKGYIYFAMAFAIVVEAINLRVRHSHVTATQQTDLHAGLS